MRYLINFSYDGSKFDGYQVQKDKVTVEGSVENILSNRFNKNIKMYASGRTDKGVHAINQYAHFDAEEVDTQKLVYYLNRKLKNIYIKNIIIVDESFHARFNVKSKIYKYIINIGEYNVFESDYALQYCKNLNLNKIKEVIPLFIGTHNFENFTITKDKKESYVREIKDIRVEKEKDKVVFYIEGNGFLHFMVRNIIGSFISLSEGKIDKEEIKKMINNEVKDKPIKVSGCGLYLYDVNY